MLKVLKFLQAAKNKKKNDRRSKKRDINLKRKIRDALNIEELVNFLAQRLKKKDAPERLYKIHKYRNFLSFFFFFRIY